MAMSGDIFLTLLREVWAPELRNTLFYNDWFFNQSFFRMLPSPGGASINIGTEYSDTDNTEAANYDDAVPAPSSGAQIQASFTKDFVHGSTRVFNQYIQMMKNGGTETASLDASRAAFERVVKQLKARIVGNFITDLEAGIDAANTWSDTALVRATYNAVSYEQDTATTLTMAHIEDALEALMTHTTYGTGVTDVKDLLWMVPQNHFTNIARLYQGTTSFVINSDAANAAKIDPGRMHKIGQLDGVDLVVTPGMTTTTLLLVHKPDILIYENQPLTAKKKEEMADTEVDYVKLGYNLVVDKPVNHAKLSGKTA